jgi:Peptidase family C25/Propeptide_C25
MFRLALISVGVAMLLALPISAAGAPAAGAGSSTGATTTVLRSDASGLVVRVDLPKLRLVPQEGGGRKWMRLAQPDTDTAALPGTPGIPVVSSILAVPDGARLSVAVQELQSVTLDGVDVYPAQPDPLDDVTRPPDFLKEPFAAKPFTLDRAAYAQPGFAPARPAESRILGKSRDLTIAALQVPAAQYDPVLRRLKMIQSIVVQLSFDGGKGFNSRLGSAWEAAQARTAGSLLNANVVNTFRDPSVVIWPCGEELLVITNASTRTAADTYANARRAAGYRTTVREVGAGAWQIGTTPTEIQTFIRSRLNSTFCIHPSYVTIIGDDQLVPTWTATPGSIPSDNPYSTRDDADELPDVAVGRILGDDLAQVDTAIAKIIAYETTPPTGPMLSRATVAAQFQDDNLDGREDRTFVQFAETVRNGLAGLGVGVDRIYTDSPVTSPAKFNDGTSLPASLLKPTFPWTGNGADITTAWNDGRFLVVHRDHGWSDGWGDPFYTTTDVDALTNGAELPVLLSINCASAAYDIDDTSFVQDALVNPNGGAAGVFGDTRNSPSWHNSQIALGFVDALLPSILPSEGPATKQRVGDALVHGKLRLAGISPPASDGSTRSELYLWHYFGDPTMQMWGGNPSQIVLPPKIYEMTYKEIPPWPVPNPPDPPPYVVQVTLPVELAGQPISLLHRGEVVGKAIIGEDGLAEIAPLFGDGSVKPSELSIALDADGYAPLQVPVQKG